jgi:hypothetical protein
LNLSSVSTCVLLVYNPTYLCMVSFTTAMPSPYIYKMTTRWLTILHPGDAHDIYKMTTR